MENFKKFFSPNETPGITGYTPTQSHNRFLRANLGTYEGVYFEPLFDENFSGGLGYRSTRTGEQIWLPKYAVQEINTAYFEYEAGNWQPGTRQASNPQTVTTPEQGDPAAATGEAGTAGQAAVASVRPRSSAKRTSRQSLMLSDINPNASKLLGQ